MYLHIYNIHIRIIYVVIVIHLLNYYLCNVINNSVAVVTVASSILIFEIDEQYLMGLVKNDPIYILVPQPFTHFNIHKII